MRDADLQFAAIKERLLKLQSQAHLETTPLDPFAVVDVSFHRLRIDRELRSLSNGISEHDPVSRPLDKALAAISDLKDWCEADGAPGIDRLDQLVTRAAKALDQAGQIWRVEIGLEQVGSLRAHAVDAIFDGDLGRSHGLIRRMIELLQGVGPQVRGLEQTRER
jgi:hypothetical protein